MVSRGGVPHTSREVIKTAVVAGAMLEGVGSSQVAAARSVPRISLPTPRARALMGAFGLKYPIFEAPIGTQTSPELCIAVANAGAMGALAAFTFFDSEETTRKAVSKVRSGTKGDFFVNFILEFEATTLQAALDAGAPNIQFSFGAPTRAMVAAVRGAGAKLGMQVTSTEGARENSSSAFGESAKPPRRPGSALPNASVHDHWNNGSRQS